MAWAGVLAFVLSAGCSAPQPTVEPTDSPSAAPADESQVAQASLQKPMRAVLLASTPFVARHDEPEAAEPAETAESTSSAEPVQAANDSKKSTRGELAGQRRAAPSSEAAQSSSTQEPPAERKAPAPEAKDTQEDPKARDAKKEEPKEKPSGCGSAAPEPPWVLDQGKDQSETSAQQGQPQWVCEQTKVKAEPVWAGDPVKFVFGFRNAGNAPLKVHAKGG